MGNDSKYSQLTHSYWALRNAVGWIGLLLPFVLMFGVFLIFGGNIIHESISHYYYTGMRNVFVGALCAVALFMFFYKGFDKTDDWVGHIAGFFALLVAWFPTTEMGPSTFVGKIHFISAALLFLTLTFFSLFLFTKTKKESTPTTQKLKRNMIYKICGVIMLLCLIAVVIYKNFIQAAESKSSFVFWAETVALVAFGVSWLTKGETIYPDKPEETSGS